MRNVALIVASLALFTGLSGCSSEAGGLLDSTAVELSALAVDAKAFAAADEECPSLVDPQAPTNRQICQILARLDYPNHLDCAQYQLDHDACDAIPN